MYTIISAKRLSNGAPGFDIYTKSGTVRKDCAVTHFEGTPEEMAELLKDMRYQATGKPYVFTHIEGRDLFGCRSIVKQSVNDIPVSPIKLAELLGV